MDNEKRLQEIEKESETLNVLVEEKEKNDPNKGWEAFCAHMKPEWDALAKLGRERRMLMTPKFEDIPEYGDVMTLKDWLECVEEGGFIDYDGHGRYVRDGKESDIMIYPSDVRYDSIRDDFDTIIWFNR